MPTLPAEHDLLRALAERTVAISETIAADAVDFAKTCLVHHLKCCLAGRDLPWSVAAVELAEAHGYEHAAAGSATIVAGGRSAAIKEAIFANAVLGQSTLAEDVHSTSLVHAGAVVIPVAMALAEARALSGRRLLASMVAGYEVAGRVGAALKTKSFAAHGFRPTAVFGPLGAAAAAAVLLGLDVDETVSALAIAVNCAGGLREWAYAGTTDVYAHAGFAARDGYESAVLAQLGFTGPETAISGAAGMMVAFAGGAPLARPPDLGGGLERSVLGEIEFKRFPACSGVQSAIELAVRLSDELPPEPERIASVLVKTHAHGKFNPGCDSAGPWATIGHAQMSNQCGVALALLGRRPVTMEDYAHFADSDVLDFAGRIRVEEDPELTRAYPARSGTRIVVRLADGTRVDAEIEDGSGLDRAEVYESFVETVGLVHAPSRVQGLLAELDRLEDSASSLDLVELLRAPSADVRRPLAGRM